MLIEVGSLCLVSPETREITDTVKIPDQILRFSFAFSAFFIHLNKPIPSRAAGYVSMTIAIIGIVISVKMPFTDLVLVSFSKSSNIFINSSKAASASHRFLLSEIFFATMPIHSVSTVRGVPIRSFQTPWMANPSSSNSLVMVSHVKS